MHVPKYLYISIYIYVYVSMGAYVMPHNWATFNCQKMEIILVKRQSHMPLNLPLSRSLSHIVFPSLSLFPLLGISCIILI